MNKTIINDFAVATDGTKNVTNSGNQETGKWITTWNGPYTAIQGDVSYSLLDKMVQLRFPNILSTVTTPNALSSVSPMPFDIRPGSTLNGNITALDNTLGVLGNFGITSTGIMTVFSNNFANFTTGSSGILAGCVTYSIV